MESSDGKGFKTGCCAIKMNYEVTIGIPVYNAEKYIRRAMDSALAQTFASIDYLILDDCGTDSSIAIVKEYQQTSPRGKDIRILSQPFNKGIGEARNRILDEAHGKYLFFMDADDAIAPNAIELLYDASQKYDAEIVYGSHERIESFGGKINHVYRKYSPMVFLKGNDFAQWTYQNYNNLEAMTCNMLIKVDVYRKNNLRYLPISYLEDMVFSMDLPAYITRAVLLEDITYFYYCKDGSASKYEKRTLIEKKEVQCTIDAMNILKNNSAYWKDKPFFTKRMCKVLMTCFFIATHIIKKEGVINPPFTNEEIRNVMRMPSFIIKMFKPGPCMLKNLYLCLLGLLPPSLTVWLIKKRI